MRRDVLWPAGLGLLATLLVAAGTTGLSYTGFGTTRADSTLGVRWAGRWLMLAGLPLTIGAWLLAHRVAARWQWPLLALWALPLLFVAPVLSRDMYAYAEQGYLVLQGLDPYAAGMGTRGGPFADLVDVFWRGTTTVYAPGALGVQALVVQATGADRYWSVIAMRVPAILGLVLMGLLAPRLAAAVGTDPRTARWAVLLNPLSVLHIVGGGHNDALAAGLATVAVWLALPGANGARRWGWLAGCLVAGLAASVKQPLALVVVGAAAVSSVPRGSLRRRLLGLAARTGLGTLLAVVAFLVVTAVTGLGFGWLTGSGSPASVKTAAPASLLADAASLIGLLSFQGALQVTAPVVLVAGAALAIWWGWRTLAAVDSPATGSGTASGALAFLAGAFTVVVLALPGFQAWYLLWGVPYAAALGWFDRYRRAVVGVVVFCLAVAWQSEGVGIEPLTAAIVAAALGVLVAVTYRPAREPA